MCIKINVIAHFTQVISAESTYTPVRKDVHSVLGSRAEWHPSTVWDGNIWTDYLVCTKCMVAKVCFYVLKSGSLLWVCMLLTVLIAESMIVFYSSQCRFDW